MKIEVKYGLYTGFGICLWMMAEHVLGFNSTRLDIGQFTRVFAVILPIVMIVLGIRDKRNIDFNGNLEVLDGVKCGLIISLTSGALTAIFFVVYGSFINPDYLDHLMAFEKSKMIGQGIPDAEIGPKLEAMRTMNTLPIQPMFQIVGSMISGLAISIIGSTILKKRSSVARGPSA